MNRKSKILAGALTAALLLTLSIPAFATSGDVAGAVEQTWTSAQGPGSYTHLDVYKRQQQYRLLAALLADFHTIYD